MRLNHYGVIFALLVSVAFLVSCSKQQPSSGGPPLDAQTKARIDQIKRETIPILASFANPERFTVEKRRELLIRGMDKGWPAMIADLQFVVDHLPPEDPEREGFKALLEISQKAVNKHR